MKYFAFGGPLVISFAQDCLYDHARIVRSIRLLEA